MNSARLAQISLRFSIREVLNENIDIASLDVVKLTMLPFQALFKGDYDTQVTIWLECSMGTFSFAWRNI